MDIARGLHVTQDVILEVADGFEGVGDVLVLLDVPDDFGGLGAFGEIDEVGAADDGGDAVFDEGQVGEIDTWNGESQSRGRNTRQRADRTKEGNARGIGQMELVSVLGEIPGAGHHFPHLFQHILRACVDLRPRPLQPVNRSGTEGRDDGCQRGKIVHTSTFLVQLAQSIW